LTSSGENILHNSGKVSHGQAMKKLKTDIENTSKNALRCRGSVFGNNKNS
jgi:hypothetical protein